MKCRLAPRGVARRASEAELRLRCLKPCDAHRMIVKLSPSGIGLGEYPWRVRLL